jgi:hypothetical protein
VIGMNELLGRDCASDALEELLREVAADRNDRE